METQFKPGDRVRIAETVPFEMNGKTGTLISKSHGGTLWVLQLDVKHEQAHTCDGRIADGFGYWVTDNEIEPIEPKTNFKIGDKIKAGTIVKCIASKEDCTKLTANKFTPSRNYTVQSDTEITHEFSSFKLLDDYCGDNGWCAMYFELASLIPHPCIIVRQYSNEIAGESESLTEATKIAERLAIADPGAVFHIYKLVAHTTASAPVATTELA